MNQYWKKFAPIYLFVFAIFLVIIASGSRAVTVIAESQPITRHNLIIIDAGHGGEDGGATSCTGILESQINLEIARRLDAVCHLLGFDTKMVRTSDISVYTEGNTISAKKASDLRNRVAMVNQAEHAILISIHQNTFSDNRYTGAQVFYAACEGSRELAEILQKQLSFLDADNRRQPKLANNVYLMQHIQQTGVLIECGFISNPMDEAMLRSAAYQQKLCSTIAVGLCIYLDS